MSSDSIRVYEVATLVACLDIEVSLNTWETKIHKDKSFLENWKMPL